jgi:hypothetical protein
MLVCIFFSFVCFFFSLRHSPHHAAFTLAALVLQLIGWCLYLYDWYNSNRREPETLIHLFPESPANPKERP